MAFSTSLSPFTLPSQGALAAACAVVAQQEWAADTESTTAPRLIPMYTNLSKHFIRKPPSTAYI